MPRLTDQTLENHKVPTGNFTYSATKINDLGASEFTLITIVNDVSSSVSDYKTQMEETLKKIVDACEKSPRKDNLLIRLTQFANNVVETLGFVSLEDAKNFQFDNSLKIGASTALFDASRNGIMATHDYAALLSQKRFQVNAILFVITDGDDNVSSCSPLDVKAALAKCMKDEALESVVSILIGVGIQDAYIADKLSNFQKEAGFTQYIEQKNADAKTLAKLAEFVSKSISSQSQALGSSAPSQILSF